ncbi:AVAST type 1 anti-phage system MBL fold metallo-hydrolase Avs1a [Sphingobacterium thalpophilum]|uniref:AVAST type 1 anti-phage system MBL fold metallo-hydrolase Avs1a n=1 Tax=Sphingobacterium thalpophilum TaxID=259 RepID=UPI003D981C03
MNEEPKTQVIVEAFPAENGDCLLVSHKDCHILIDTGYEETYKKYLLPRFVGLKKDGHQLSRLIITHIDQDHIHGAIPLIKDNGRADQNNIIPIKQVWHNSYRHLNKGEEKTEISVEGEQLLERLKTSGSSINQEVSFRQGSSLAADLLSGNYAWNTDFDQGPVKTPCEPITIADGVQITLLSPTEEKLEKLEKYWKRELKRIGFKDNFGKNDLFDDAYEFLILKEKDSNPVIEETPASSSVLSFDTLYGKTISEDKRPSNGSSIAFVLEMNKKKLLFLGDSHPSVILSSLKSIYGDEPLQFDFIKISHHGSYYNSNLDLLNFIDASKYCISTDGLGHHPNLETLCWIVGRPTNFKRTICFNYKHSGVTFLENLAWKTQYNYTLDYPQQEGESLKILI